ncbi:MAG: tetratricopeptide repeat protein [Candidatus Melainabacteria bacterium]|nr:tetratricopeptide repeat protein [Candidatus Melainabacteria bacterium]
MGKTNVGKHQCIGRWMQMARRSVALVLLALVMFIGMLGTASADRPIDWENKLEKGYYELSIGNVDKAREIFESKVKKYPNSGACHTALGTALKKKGKLTEAKAEFRRATEVEPTYADSFYELGAMMESDKEYLQASQVFEKYLLLKPDSNRKATVADRIRFCKEHL